MANILIANTIVPYPPHYSGNSIRIFPLSCELSRRHRCYLTAFGQEDKRLQQLRAKCVYEDILLLPENLRKKRIYRHICFRTAKPNKIECPPYYRYIVKKIRGFVEAKQIDLIIAVTLSVGEYVEDLNNIKKLLDQTDCGTLSLKRSYSLPRNKLPISYKLRLLLKILRYRYLEGQLTRKFDFVTTVSPVDRETLQQLNKEGKERIIDIPNGISPELVHYAFHAEEVPNAIAFWGALDFPPNRMAVHYFYDQVFSKYLKNAGIAWYIIGKNPDDRLIEIGTKHNNIIVTGYVDDLFGLASKIPIMINPMRTGSGLKNKVLEAFALKRLVISTRLGIDAINANKGTHYVHAEEPEQFAQEILKYSSSKDARIRIGHNARRFVLENYTWDKIGQRYLDLIQLALST